MVGLFIGLAVIAAGAATVYFIASSLGPQLFRKKTVSAILKNVKARQRTTPSSALQDIYYAVAEARAQQNQWLADANYVDLLRETGCFDPRTALSSWRAWRRRFSSAPVVRWNEDDA